MRTIRRLGLISCAFALCLLPARAHAGWDLTSSASCNKNSDNSGDCQGTFAGFFKSDGGVEFEAPYGNNGVLFYATLGKNTYTCAFTANSAYAPWFTALLASRSFFHVWWDRTGTCIQLALVNTSASGQ
jgi:hypothetical protein